MNAARLPLAANLAIFVASAAVVWFAGVRLAGYASAIANHTGIGRAFLGLVLLGGVTSLPEMAVAVTATLRDMPTLTISQVLGSAAINVVIIALADAFVRRNALTAMLPSSAVMLQGVLGIVLMTIIVAANVVGDRLVAGLGVWSWLLLAAYLTSMRILAYANVTQAWRPAERGRELQKEPQQQRNGIASTVWRTVAAGAAILVAGAALAESGGAVSEATGLGQSFFGAVFMGFATSLPEISTVVAAVRMQYYEMAVADVFGTNLFNVTIVVLVDALHGGGPVLAETGRVVSFASLLALALTAFYVIGLLERRDRMVFGLGVDSLAVLATYACGVGVLYAIR